MRPSAINADEARNSRSPRRERLFGAPALSDRSWMMLAISLRPGYPLTDGEGWMALPPAVIWLSSPRACEAMLEGRGE